MKEITNIGFKKPVIYADQFYTTIKNPFIVFVDNDYKEFGKSTEAEAYARQCRKEGKTAFIITSDTPLLLNA